MIDKTSPLPLSPPHTLLGVGFYQQQPNSEPLFDTLLPGLERIEVVTHGRGWVRVDGAMVEAVPGMMLWHVAGDQTISRSDWKAPYRCLHIRFEGNLPGGARRVPHLCWWRDLDVVESFGNEIIRASADEAFDPEALRAYIFGRLLFQGRLWEQSRDRVELPEKLRAALELIEGGEGDCGSLREVARRVGWSLAHLHEVCRLKLNATPHEIALRHSMKTARERLAGTDHPLKQIATECGFSSASAFCHAFKNRLGLTPLEYRKLNQRF